MLALSPFFHSGAKFPHTMRDRLNHILLGLLILTGICSCAMLPPSRRLSVEAVLEQSRQASAGSSADTGSPIRQPASVGSVALQWPLRTMKMASPFGRRSGGRHEGVDLQSAWGTPIYAAADGVVVYAGNEINGYGETVVLQHQDGVATLYGHASELIVAEGDEVFRGQAIAYVGDTGNATGPHLHFEVRVGKKPIDPWSYLSLPKRLTSNKRGPAATTAR